MSYVSCVIKYGHRRWFPGYFLFPIYVLLYIFVHDVFTGQLLSWLNNPYKEYAQGNMDNYEDARFDVI